MAKKNKTKDLNSSCLIYIAWLLIISWILFILFFWHSGMLHSSKNPTLLYVEGILNDTENTVLSHLRNVHLTVPVAHIISEPITRPPSRVDPAVTSSSDDVHVIFSTDCSGYQNWQSLVLFHSATIVGQKGPITRIASGCDEAQMSELKSLYAKLYPNYHIHFTPDFKHDSKSGKSCK